MKIAVVYWSSTGNTEAMAQAVVEGAKHAGAEAELFTAAEFDGGKMDEFDAVAFGCPAMGAEELESDEFEPMFTACEGMAGATASGCARGKRTAGTRAQIWSATA